MGITPQASAQKVCMGSKLHRRRSLTLQPAWGVAVTLILTTSLPRSPSARNDSTSAPLGSCHSLRSSLEKGPADSLHNKIYRPKLHPITLHQVGRTLQCGPTNLSTGVLSASSQVPHMALRAVGSFQDTDKHQKTTGTRDSSVFSGSQRSAEIEMPRFS